MNILSVDFDIIMYPCIKLYNAEVGGNCNPTELWRYLEREKEIEPFVNYDANYLLKLAKVMRAAVRQGAKLVPIQEHQEIVDFLRKQDAFAASTYNLWNIDFHHDIWYRDEDPAQITSFNKYNCANWVGYLALNRKLNSYSWICAGNSEGQLNEEQRNILTNKIRLSDFELGDTKFDYVFFCLSPQWVPYKFHHLYHLLEVMLNDEYSDGRE